MYNLSNLVNLTPHEIIIRDCNGLDHCIKPSGRVARVVMEELENGEAGWMDGSPGIPVIRRNSTKVEGLPDTGTPCIVSSMVLDAVGNRYNVFAPDTGSTAIRNEQGQVVAVTRLVTGHLHMG